MEELEDLKYQQRVEQTKRMIEEVRIQELEEEENRGKRMDPRTAEEIPDDTDISENLVNTESVRELQTAIKTLPLLHQEIIMLKFEDEQTNVQIADSLGMNASTVGTILNRSMKKLRKILEEYYHD